MPRDPFDTFFQRDPLDTFFDPDDSFDRTFKRAWKGFWILWVLAAPWSASHSSVSFPGQSSPSSSTSPRKGIQ